jgi:hypothetical protein
MKAQRGTADAALFEQCIQRDEQVRSRFDSTLDNHSSKHALDGN